MEERRGGSVLAKEVDSGEDRKSVIYNDNKRKALEGKILKMKMKSKDC